MKQSSKIELISPLLVVEREIFIVRQANRPLAHNGIAESIDICVYKAIFWSHSAINSWRNELCSKFMYRSRLLFYEHKAHKSLNLNVLSRSPKYDWNFTQIMLPQMSQTKVKKIGK